MKLFNTGRRSGGNGAGVNVAVTSWAQLAAISTLAIVPGEPGSVVCWVETATGLFHVVQLRAGADANEAGAVQRPDDFNVVLNSKVWYKCNAP